MHPSGQLKRLEEAHDRFRACIRLLPEALFTTLMDGWSPRDVVAHLVGWNRHTVAGCRDILDGRKPKYLADHVHDFSNVNAESIERYSTDDRDELLTELDKSFAELRVYLESVDAKQWEAHCGVPYDQWVIYAPHSVDALCDDYDAHREEIERWSLAVVPDT